MPTDDPRACYLLKPIAEEIGVNRTIKVIGDGPFVVSVTDRDYVDDPSGQTQTIVFRKSYASIDDATTEMKRQVELSLADSFIHNQMGMT